MQQNSIEDPELEKLKDELSELVAFYELRGGKVPEKHYERLNELKQKGNAVELKTAIDHFKREKAGLEKK